MPIYEVRHTAKVDYLICVEAENEEQAKSEESYSAACEGPASEHYWWDSEIEQEYSDDEDAPDPDISLL